MKTLLLFLLISLSVSAQKKMVKIEGFQKVEYRVVTATITERFIKDGNTIITADGKEYGKQEVVSYTFIIVDPMDFYKKKLEYVFKLKANTGTYDFAYEFIAGCYSPKQTRILISNYLK